MRVSFFLFLDCSSGTYGSACKPCGQCKNDVVCDRVSGQCPSGCEVGWSGTRCDQGNLFIYLFIYLFICLYSSTLSCRHATAVYRVPIQNGVLLVGLFVFIVCLCLCVCGFVCVFFFFLGGGFGVGVGGVGWGWSCFILEGGYFFISCFYSFVFLLLFLLYYYYFCIVLGFFVGLFFGGFLGFFFVCFVLFRVFWGFFSFLSCFCAMVIKLCRLWLLCIIYVLVVSTCVTGVSLVSDHNLVSLKARYDWGWYRKANPLFTSLVNEPLR